MDRRNRNDPPPHGRGIPLPTPGREREIPRANPREARGYADPDDARSPEIPMMDRPQLGGYPGNDRDDPGARRLPRDQRGEVPYQPSAPLFHGGERDRERDRDRERERERERERDRERDIRTQPRGYGDSEDSPMTDFAREPPGQGRTYFLPAEGISHEVIQADICRYLGNNATVRRAERHGVRGYVINAYRQLTDAQLETLVDDTKRFEEEQRRQINRGHGRLAYENSHAFTQHQTNTGRHDQYDPGYDRPPSQGPHEENQTRGYAPSYPTANPYQNPMEGGGRPNYIAQPGSDFNNVPRHPGFPAAVTGEGRGLPPVVPPNPAHYAHQQGNPPLPQYPSNQPMYPSNPGRGGGYGQNPRGYQQDPRRRQ